MSDHIVLAPESGLFLAEQAHVYTATGFGASDDDEARPFVMVTLTGRWNHGDVAELQVGLAPELADEFGRFLQEAAPVAHADLARFLERQT